MITPGLEDEQPQLDGFELPCGYLDADGTLHTYIEVQGMNGNDEEVLAAKNMPIMKKMNKILTRCTIAIGDFKDRAQIEKIIPELTQGDRVYLLFAIRRVSLGDAFPFVTECPNCSYKCNLTVNLGDLDIKKMPDPKIRTYTITLGRTKKVVQMKVLTGHGEEAISKAAISGKDLISVAMLVRIDGMDGAPINLAALKELPLADRNQIKDAWLDREGGVDTEVDVECTNCDMEYKTDVDIGSVGFFNPLAQSRTSSKA